MSVNEALFPKTYQGLLKRLHAVIQNKEIRDKMSAEDDFLAEMQAIADLHTRELASARRKQERAERQKEQAERQKEEERQQKDEAIRLLLQLGVSKAEIAQKLGLSEEDMERL